MGRTSDARQRLIDAASQLMWERGYADVGVQELCREAGVKPGSFYYFFGSKADLGVEALEANWQRTRAYVLDPAAEADDPLDRLSRLVSLIHQTHAAVQEKTGRVFGCPFGNLSGEMTALDPIIQEKLGDIFSRYYAFFETILHDAQDQGLVQIDDIPRKAKSLFALIEGIQMLAHTHNNADLITDLTPDIHALIAV